MDFKNIRRCVAGIVLALAAVGLLRLLGSPVTVNQDVAVSSGPMGVTNCPGTTMIFFTPRSTPMWVNRSVPIAWLRNVISTTCTPWVRTSAQSPSAIGVPGWPDWAFSTASIMYWQGAQEVESSVITSTMTSLYSRYEGTWTSSNVSALPAIRNTSRSITGKTRSCRR